MTERLGEALEVCLNAIERGADVEACLALFPDLADDLRPLLITATQARAARVTEMPATAFKRGRARLLNAAAELREQRAAARRQPWWTLGRSLRLGTVALIVITLLLTSGTGIVYASNGALPGDQLYPVKRQWEGFQLMLALTQQAQQTLQVQFAEERREEVEALFDLGREAEVEFEGVVVAKTAEGWIVGGFPVQVTAQTEVRGAIQIGQEVEVKGYTTLNGVVATRLRVEDEQEDEGGEESEEHDSGVSSSASSSESASSSSRASSASSSASASSSSLSGGAGGGSSGSSSESASESEKSESSSESDDDSSSSSRSDDD